METYRTFIRDWWKRDIHGKLVPYHDAPKQYVKGRLSESEAREMCKEYNSEHDAGELSRKMEWESEY